MRNPDPAPPAVGQTYHAFAAAFHGSREVVVIGYVSRTPGCGNVKPSTLWRVRDKQTGRTFLVEPWMIGTLEPEQASA